MIVSKKKTRGRTFEETLAEIPIETPKIPKDLLKKCQ